jgi:VanZ family protein
MSLNIKLFQYIFWTGYLTVLITALLPIKGSLNKIHIGPELFHIRLDHLLHLIVYFLICMYYLFGLRIGFALFVKNSLLKFVLIILFLATITEIIQLWVPIRSFNVFDLVSNVAGVIIGVGVVKMVQRLNRTKSRRYKGIMA